MLTGNLRFLAKMLPVPMGRMPRTMSLSAMASTTARKVPSPPATTTLSISSSTALLPASKPADLESVGIRKKYNFSVIGNIRTIKTISLEDLVELSPPFSGLVFKIDTEGHQCQFMAGRIGWLYRKGAIICLELDSAGNMDKFNETNKNVINQLLEVGYRLIWLDHRQPKEVLFITEYKEFINRNSLVIALPDCGPPKK